MGYYMRYFADAPLTLAAIKSGLLTADPQFKIDGGELTRGADMLGELEINLPGSDLFADEVGSRIQQLESHREPNARHVIDRLRGTKAVLALQVLDEGRADQLGPLWNVVQALANGLWQIDGQGFYDNGQLVVPLA